MLALVTVQPGIEVTLACKLCVEAETQRRYVALSPDGVLEFTVSPVPVAVIVAALAPLGIPEMVPVMVALAPVHAA
jgi:hypothetical protein